MTGVVETEKASPNARKSEGLPKTEMQHLHKSTLIVWLGFFQAQADFFLAFESLHSRRLKCDYKIQAY